MNLIDVDPSIKNLKARDPDLDIGAANGSV